MCWGITCDIALEGRWRRSRANTTPLPDTGVPKTQTTSEKMGGFGVFCMRCSAFWVPRPSGRPLDGGIALQEGATRRRHTGGGLRVVQNPLCCRCGEQRRRWRVWLRCPWAVAGPGPDKFRMQFPHDTDRCTLKNRRISTIRLQHLKCTQGNCMRNRRDAVRSQRHTAAWPRRCGGRGRAWLRCLWAAGPGPDKFRT